MLKHVLAVVGARIVIDNLGGAGKDTHTNMQPAENDFKKPGTHQPVASVHGLMIHWHLQLSIRQRTCFDCFTFSNVEA